MSCIYLARACAIRCANRAGAAMRPRTGEPRAIQGPDAGTDRVGKNGTEHDIS